MLALVGFGFLSLRWEKRAQDEELRARCLALTEPLRREFFARITEADYLREGRGTGDVEALPVPGGESDSLARYIEGEYQVVLGQAGALSETGLPLRPLAAVRLLRIEEDPKRLEELTRVIAAEPGFITPRLLVEAEDRHQELGLPIPPVLRGWEERLERRVRVRAALDGRDPEQLLAGAGSLRWLSTEHGSMLMIRTPSGPALVDRSSTDAAAVASQASIADALPAGVEAVIALHPASSDGIPELTMDSGVPPVHFLIVDAAALDLLSTRRCGLFVTYLVIAATAGAFGCPTTAPICSTGWEKTDATRSTRLPRTVGRM